MSRWFKNIVIKFIDTVIPKRGKRIIFIVMCYMIWSKSEDENQIRLELIEINNKLNLSKDEEALQFAIVLRNILLSLDDFKLAKTLPKEEIRNKLVSRMPQWLKYDDCKILEEEANVVFCDNYCHQTKTII